MIACLDQLLQTGFLQSQIIQEHCLLIIIQFRDLFLDLCADDEYFAVLTCCKLSDLRYHLIGGTVICQIILGYIGCIDHRFVGQQIVFLQQRQLVLIGNFQALRHLAALQMLLDTL